MFYDVNMLFYLLGRVSKSKIADGCGWCASCSLLLLVNYEMDRSVVSFAGSLNFDPAFDPGTLFNLIPT